MRSKRACPHCRLPAAAIAAAWYVRSHNVRPHRRSKDELDQLLDRVTQLENENTRLAKAVQAAPTPAVVEQLRADLVSARAQLAQLQTENARLARELQSRPTAVAGGPRTDIEHQQDQDSRLDGQIQSRLVRLHDQLVQLRSMVE
ncbi:hypothetical protein DY240_01205 [Jiangella rhizosphaerae]|uniref:Uncharacterized protein n=2 Tax=Jiangella rhizosphaerae TaxID=2293569 RepID=A0A418KX36_9ACTN|nr:hypothetical protein DY240_01205 [Jiangella rhizosphaerae]